MFDAERFFKTEKGREELARRSQQLSKQERTALIMIDGKTPWMILRVRLARVGILLEAEQIVRQLIDRGFVESDHEIPAVPVLSFPSDNKQTSQLNSEPHTLMP